MLYLGGGGEAIPASSVSLCLLSAAQQGSQVRLFILIIKNYSFIVLADSAGAGRAAPMF
jgi:hypothetical protein